MHEVVKQMGGQLAATSSAGHLMSHLFYVSNRSTKMQYLVNRGTEISVVPPSSAPQKVKCQGPSLQAVNNNTIATYGTCSITLDLRLLRAFR